MKTTLCKSALLVLFLIQAGRISFAGNTAPDISNQQPADAEKLFFEAAKTELSGMLVGKRELSYERAVFVTENAFAGNTMNYYHFINEIGLHTKNIQQIYEAVKKTYPKSFKETFYATKEEQERDYDRTLINYAIFTYLTDTLFYRDKDGIHSILPFQYSKEDPFARKEWKNSQVTNLLKTRKGNCYALAALYMIFSERMGAEANLATAPGHIFVQHRDPRGSLFNVDLSTRSFPGLGSIETVTYTTDKAVRNGIAMRSLDDSQAVGLCLVFLARGYKNKFGTGSDKFIYDCAEEALTHDPKNLNALLLKAEVLEERLIGRMKERNLQSVEEIKTDPEYIVQFNEYESLIHLLYTSGYREMPLQMKQEIYRSLQGKNADTGDYISAALTGNNKGTTRYASLSWGRFDEMHKEKPLEKYFHTVFDTQIGKIIGFEERKSEDGIEYFDPVVAALSVDPAFKKYPDLSPYSAFENSPISIVDPGGDTTVYYSQTGQRLHISYDELPTAIVIVNDKQLARFNIELKVLKEINKGHEHGKSSNERWRSYGKMFDVKSLREFYNKNTIKKIDNKSPESPTGYNSEGYFNETKGILYEKGGVIKPGDKTIKGGVKTVIGEPEDESDKGNRVGIIHTHPNEGLPDEIGTFRYGPSKNVDLINAGKTDVIVGRENIYIYGSEAGVVSIDKKTLNPGKLDK
jgi:hypothetical protein